MALTMYMKVIGKNQGEIKGSCDQGGDKKDKAKFSFNNRLRSVYYGFNNVYESYR